MNITIFTQNKENLLKPNLIGYAYDQDTKMHFIVGTCSDNTFEQNLNIGNYATRERCVEIITEIKELENKIHRDKLSGVFNGFYPVFEMPDA